VLVQQAQENTPGFSDKDYRKAAHIRRRRRKVWGADLVVKVKEPLPHESKIAPRTDPFYLSASCPNPALVKALLQKRSTAIGL